MQIFISKIVIDTNIYISAIFWGGKPREVIELGRSGHIWIFSSSEIEKEIDEKLRLKFKLDADEAIYVLLDFATFTTPVKITNRIKAVPDDPDDDKFIECALSCRADYIVSGDRHLLQLKEYKGIRIIKAADFLRLYKKAGF